MTALCYHLMVRSATENPDCPVWEGPTFGRWKSWILQIRCIPWPEKCSYFRSQHIGAKEQMRAVYDVVWESPLALEYLFDHSTFLPGAGFGITLQAYTVRAHISPWKASSM